METLSNLDLLTVGIAIASNLIIGFAAYFSNKRSATNILFFIQTLILSIWSTVNYISYQPYNSYFAAILVRLVLFFAVPNSVVFLLLMHTFPSEKLKISRRTLFILCILTGVVMVFTLSPLVFSDVVINGDGAPTPIVGPGIIAFLVLGVLSIPLGIYYLLRNYFKSSREMKGQFKLLLIGVIIMFFLIIVFNFIFPALLQNTAFIPFSAFFTFPFVFLTAYAVYRHKLFNIKDIATVVLALALTIVTFIEIIYSQNSTQIIFRSSIFILVLIFSVRLVKNMFILEAVNERLKELDQLKSEFVSLATHQLRAPLTSIKGYISLIQEGDYGPVSPQVSEALDIIYKSTQNLVLVVGDFLDVSRIELGKMKYEFAPVDINKLLGQITTELKPVIDKSGLAFTYHADPGKNYTINGDIGKLKQIFTNLIDNSTKYTPKGSVDVSLSRVGDKILFKISDTGIGMAPELIPQLFNKFSRLKDAGKANILGTGLGLYVVKQMVEAHNGRVWAESDGSGKGSRFFVELTAVV